jgi:putative ABC transport system permease protein
MKTADALAYTLAALRAGRLRAALTLLGIAVGIVAVVLLTSIGAGLHDFVLAEFTQFGTHLLSVQPGRSQTHGGSVGAFGNVRPLTLEDAAALGASPLVEAVNPVVQGNAALEYGRRSRRVTVFGSGPALPRTLSMQVASGRFLPADAVGTPRAYAVLGAKAARELFADDSPLGARLRIGGAQYRVIGVMAAKGQVLGFDLDDAVYVPVARALELFNRESLMEIQVRYRAQSRDREVVAEVKRILDARHGDEDYTVITQREMLDVMGSVLDVLTFAVAALGGISLLVGGVGVLTIMTIAVQERRAEVGLLRALGAPRALVLRLFLAEAVLLASLGGVLGLAGGWLLAQALARLLPALPVHTPWLYAVAALGVSALIGLLAGVLPARHAAQVEPVAALRGE